MAIIGKLTKQADGSFKGNIATLNIRAAVTLRYIDQADIRKRGPVARVFSGFGEVGGAFEATTEKTGEVYLSIKLDDPTLAAPFYVAAFPNKEKPEDLDLVWSRPKAS